MAVRIERVKPRFPNGEHPYQTRRGYELADPQIGHEWHFAKNAIHMKSLDEAADLIEARGFAIRMSGP